MKVYQISLSVRSDKLSSAKKCIETFNHTCQFFNNTWFIATNKTALHLREVITSAISEHDSLMISRVKPDAAWHGVDENVSRSIKRILDVCTD